MVLIIDSGCTDFPIMVFKVIRTNILNDVVASHPRWSDANISSNVVTIFPMSSEVSDAS